MVRRTRGHTVGREPGHGARLTDETGAATAAVAAASQWRGEMKATARRRGGAKAPRRVRGTGAAEVYRHLREEILSLALRPGAPLDEARLSARFQLSRSPVREALIRLSAEGLVVTLPNRSTLVAPFDLESLPRYLDALDLMQRTVTRLAALLRTPADVHRIRVLHDGFEEALARRDPLQMIEGNRNFHVAIAEAGRNPYFTSLYTRLLDEGRRMMRVYFAYLGDTLPQEFRDEHTGLVEAVAAGDVDRAERLAHAHAVQFSGRFLDHLATRLSAGVSVAGYGE
jgi:DNA-binding GntR family transcriptional regulator